MKNIYTMLLSLAFTLLITASVFAQSNVDTVFGVPINQLYRGNIAVPSDIKIQSIKFFNIVADSHTNMTINLFDENQILLWKVVVIENSATGTIEYKIFDSNSNLHWFRTTKTIENDKIIVNATSSSGKTMKVTTLKGNTTSTCSTNTPIGSVEVIVNNELPQTISNDDMQTSKGISQFPDLMQQAEGKFFDTEPLKVLQNIVFVSDTLQSLVIEKSNIVVPQEQEQGVIPNCSVFCIRMGAIIPAYHCNSVTLNCNRCGVSGVYFLRSRACFWICTVSCGTFYT